jgi:hypothetical protein
MREFGLDEEFIRTYEYEHTITTLNFRELGFKTIVAYQRKSGDALTFLGNTILNMAAIAYSYDIIDD